MVSRSNLSGRPRPSGVLKTVQEGPAPSDDLAVGAEEVGGVTGPRRRRQAVRRELNGGGDPSTWRYGEPPEIGIDDPNPDVIEPPPVIQVPPTPGPGSMPLPGGSRTGGGAGYRARTGNIARETTEAQERAGREGRFLHPRRTAPLTAQQHPLGVGRYGGAGMPTPRWEGSEGGGGYGTDPGPRPEPPPAIVPDEPPPTTRPPRDRDGRRGGRRSRGGPGPKQRR